MSSPLVTLGRSRRSKILGDHHDHLGKPMDVQMSRETPAARDQRRAAPFKDNAAYLVASLPSSNSFPQEKVQFTLGKEHGLSDFDLLSSTVKRVSELETRVKLQAREIQLKDQEIAALEQKIKKLQTRRTDNPPVDKQVYELEKKCQELQKKVNDMEHFLSDYGLIWVGDEGPSESTEQMIPQSNAGQSSYSFQPDFDLILENIQDLNVLGGEGVSHVEYKEGAARLRSPESVPLTLYKNGILMFQGPFRSYQEPSTQQCLRDIMDGYFPSELQTRFPDGVPFQVTDMRNVVFNERRSWDQFPGPGQSVGCAEKNLVKTSEKPGPRLSVQQFLNRLPKSVIQGGRVIDVQGPIRDNLLGSNADEKTQESLVESPLVLSMDNGPQANAVVCTLRVKSEAGDHTYKVRMLHSETIGDLRFYLSQHRSCDISSCDIISLFPHHVYDHNACTLQEAGLVPNALLLLRKKKPKDPENQEPLRLTKQLQCDL
ncbi:UBX domain-containing protein 11 isoform X2 [Hyla sarda]|uniref:UBX domain-containing protein 11 isoform X2 n=1 Tax=Hyla sarda TaxID=327740 RepID=UPI0024C26266|nr:UBX domain-containing protein 11 isoform X2 [Hyla sarda]